MFTDANRLSGAKMATGMILVCVIHELDVMDGCWSSLLRGVGWLLVLSAQGVFDVLA